MDIAGGTVTISKSQIENNVAFGGYAGELINTADTLVVGSSTAGGAAGGGLYVGGGTIHLKYDIIQNNQAKVGFSFHPDVTESSNASGGGLYVVTGTIVTEDLFTLGNLTNNTDNNNFGNNNFGNGGPIG